MCLVPKIKIPDPPALEAPPLPAETAKSLVTKSPNPKRKILSSRRAGKSALTIARGNTGLNI